MAKADGGAHIMAYARPKTIRNGAVRWYAAYLGADGRYHEQGGFSTEKQALSAAARLEADAARGEWASPVASRMTFRSYVDRHYWPLAMHLEVSTRAAYKSYLDKHFLPQFGSIPMRRISASHIQTWVNTASKELSPRSVGKYHAFLHKIFARAVVDRVVASNPCAHTVLPKVVAKPKRIVTVDEFDAIVAAIPERHRMMVLLAIETGLRWGELIALRPMDIDFVTRTVHVRRTLVEVSHKHAPNGQRIFVKDYPKDDEPRLIQIESATCRQLKGHVKELGLEDSALLFTSSAGTPISRNNFRTKTWGPALLEAEIADKVTFHNLRAAHASWLLAGGADIQVVKERLGHRQIMTTQQYLGTLPDAGDRALEAFRKIRGR